MSSLRQQVIGIIETCKTALAAKNTPALDKNTIAVASAILAEAKADLPADKILMAVTLEGASSWMAVLSAMETVQRSLPLPRPGRIQPGR